MCIFHIWCGAMEVTAQWELRRNRNCGLGRGKTRMGCFRGLDKDLWGWNYYSANFALPPTYGVPEAVAVGVPVAVEVGVGVAGLATVISR